MTILAHRPMTNKRVRFACKRMKMKKKPYVQATKNTLQPNGTSTFLFLLGLILVFTIVACCRPH